MLRAFASRSVDLGFISLNQSYQKTFKIVFTAFLLGAHHKWDRVGNKPASSLAVSLGNALDEIPALLYGRPIVELKSWWASLI